MVDRETRQQLRVENERLATLIIHYTEHIDDFIKRNEHQRSVILELEDRIRNLQGDSDG